MLQNKCNEERAPNLLTHTSSLLEVNSPEPKLMNYLQFQFNLPLISSKYFMFRGRENEGVRFSPLLFCVISITIGQVALIHKEHFLLKIKTCYAVRKSKK